MGKFLMYAGFFVALLAIGQAIVESDFGAKATDFFTLSTYFVISAVIIFFFGEFLERRRIWVLDVNNPGAGTSFQKGLRTNVRAVNVLLLNLKAHFLWKKLRAKK